LLKRPIQFIITASSLVIFSLLTVLIVHADRDADYDKISMSLHFIVAWLAAFVIGIIMIFIRKKYRKLLKRGIFYNIIGTFNIFITVIGVPYIYYDSSKKISAGLIFFLPTLVMGAVDMGRYLFYPKSAYLSK
jgi:hypothetical protein